MRRAIVTLLVLLSFGLKAQVYQAMPQAGYGPVKRMLFDSVLTIPLNINQLRNITGGRDAGQIRYNVSDSGLYVFTGYTWIKANLDSVNLSNRINGKLNISDTAYMLSWYMRKTDTLSLSNRINLRVKYTDTAAMLDPYLRKLDTASLSRRIDEKQNIIKLTTNFKSGAATLIRDTLNIPKYSDTLSDAYVPYVGANKDVDLGVYDLTGTFLTANAGVEIQDNGAGIGDKVGYTSLYTSNEAFNFRTSRLLPNNLTKSRQATFLYPVEGDGYLTTFNYNLPVRTGTLALVEDTVNLSNRINLKADKATTLTINGVTYNLSANRSWTIPVFDSTSISNRIDLKLNISDTASMLSPYLRKVDTSSLSNRIDLRVKYSDTASMLSPYLRKADTSSLSNRIDLRVKYSDTAAMLSPYLKSAVTSVGLSMPNAFSVANSPITSTGTLAVSAVGTSAQYIRGDGQLATLPITTGGGSSVNYYLNGGVSQGTIGGSTYYEMSKDAVIATSADFNRTNAQGDGLIAQFITDVNDPNRLEIPAGAWNFELFFSASSSGGTPAYYVELLKYDGSTFTLIASNSSTTELITGGTATDLYLSSLAVPYTTLAVTDRLVVRVYVITSGKTITLHTQNGNLCEIITTFAGGVSSLNGLTANTQYLAVGTSGTDFAISSLTDTHTFNLPTASATNRGALSSADWSTFNGKMNYSDTVSLSNRINTKLNSSDTASLSNRINAKADALSGTTNTVPKFTSSTTIGNSNIKDDGNAVTVNATAGNFGALQVGSYNGNILMNTTNSNGGLIFQNTSSSNKLWDFSSDNNDLVFNESNIAPVMKLKAGGNVVISNLSGTGTRMVVADANGVLSTQAISSDTTSLSNRINLKLNISDTASMLSGYQSAINSKQAQINGTGFVKASGTTISYDNSTYYLASNPNGYTSNTGTVTSVASGLGLSGGTITTSGTLLVDTASASILSRQRAANTYYLASNPNGYTSNTGTVTSVATGLGLSGGTISTSGTLLVDTSSASILSRQRAANTYATTSSLSGYLPLTGGTLTGALGGTSATFSGLVTGQTNLGFINTNSSQAGFVADYTGTGALKVSFSTYNDVMNIYNETNGYSIMNFTRSSKNLVINPSGGNVLINTSTDAGYKLDVNGTGRFSGVIHASGARVNILGGNQNTVWFNQNAGGGSTGFLVGRSYSNDDAQNFFIYDVAAAAPRLFIASGGNVGIGTNNPFTKLQVSAIPDANGESVYQILAFDTNTATSRLGAGISFGGYYNGTTDYTTAFASIKGFKENTTNNDFAGAMSFQTRVNGGSSTERVRITSGGNVGIGTTSPNLTAANRTVLAINGTTTNLIDFSIGGTNQGYIYNTTTDNIYWAEGARNIQFGIAGAGFMGFGTNNTERMRITSGGDINLSNISTAIPTIRATSSSGGLSLWAGATADYDGGAGITLVASDRNGTKTRGEIYIYAGNAVNNTSNGFIDFGTASISRMRITSGGSALVGKTTDDDSNQGIRLAGQFGFMSVVRDGDNTAVFRRNTNNGNIMLFNYAGTTVGSISTNTYSLPSDLNFKKNINTLDLGLNLINKLRPVSYNYKIDDENSSLSTGFIAQELEQSLNELGVKENEYYILQHKEVDDKKQSQYWLDYTKMIPVLTKGIQELSKKLDELSAKNEALIKRIETLENK